MDAAVNIRRALAELDAWWKAQMARVVELATGTTLGGDARWDALLVELGVEALAPNERAAHVVGQSRGPAPLEVERALAAIGDAARAAAQRLARAARAEDLALCAEIDQFGRNAAATQVTAGPRVLAQLRPTRTTGSIFANARASALPVAVMDEARAEVLSCATCGSPRRGEERTRQCLYCGEKL